MRSAASANVNRSGLTPPAAAHHSLRGQGKSAEGHAAKRGGLGSKRWADIRQAARLARTEGVVLVVHGVEVSPFGVEPMCAQENLPPNSQSHRRSDEREGRGQQAMEAVASARATSPSKRQQRSAQRLLVFQEKKRAELWLSITQRLLKQSRAKLRDSTWTGWMASRPKSTPSPPPPVVASTPAVLTPAPGMRAQIFGLKSRPELNEIAGVVGEYDEATGRCALLLPSGERIAVKPSNLDLEPKLIPIRPDLPESDRSNTKRKTHGKRSKPKRL